MSIEHFKIRSNLGAQISPCRVWVEGLSSADTFARDECWPIAYLWFGKKIRFLSWTLSHKRHANVAFAESNGFSMLATCDFKVMHANRYPDVARVKYSVVATATIRPLLIDRSHLGFLRCCLNIPSAIHAYTWRKTDLKKSTNFSNFSCLLYMVYKSTYSTRLDVRYMIVCLDTCLHD